MKRIFLLAAITVSLLTIFACTRKSASPVPTIEEAGIEATVAPTEQPTIDNGDESENLEGSIEEEPPVSETGFQVVQTDVTAVVTLPDEVTFYSGPGDTYPPVARVFGGLIWPVSGASQDGPWWQLTCPDVQEETGQECWVSADPSISQPVDSTEGGVTTLPTSVDNLQVLATLGLNLRDGPGLDSNVLALLPLNEVLGVTGVSEDGEWWRVGCPDGTPGKCRLSADPTLSEPVTLNQLSLAGLVYGETNDPQRWLVDADGGSSLLVDADSLQAVRGPISPDGQFLIRGGSRGDTNLYLDELNTGESRQLTDTPDRFNFNPSWWPENPETIIFLSRALSGTSQPGQPGPANLAMVKTDGSSFQVLDDEHISHTVMPSLSGDGQTIAYDHGGETASEDGILTPWIYRLEGEVEPFDYRAYGLEELPDLSFGSPAWSPDGRYLAWVVGGDLTGDGQWEVGIANFDLEALTVQILIAYTPGSCQFVWCFEAPVWSPDGQWLAWIGFPIDSLPGFWVMRPDGTDTIFITDGGPPTWSPDGSTLAFNKLPGIQVMETGAWRPQPSGLPAGYMIMDWLDSGLITEPEETSLDKSTTLPCESVSPGSAEYVACNVQDSLISRDLAALRSYMADPFILGYWGSEGISDTPEVIIEQIKELYNYDAPDYTPRLSFTSDRSEFPPLGGITPESMFGPDVNVSLVIYSEGWEPEGQGAALFMIAQDSNGEYYLPGMAYSGEHFDK